MRILPIVVAILAVILVAAVFLWPKTTIDDGGLLPPEHTNLDLAKGWNNFIIPSDWSETTAKSLLDEYSVLTAISIELPGGGYTSYVRGYPVTYDFTISPGDHVYIYADAPVIITR